MLTASEPVPGILETVWAEGESALLEPPAAEGSGDGEGADGAAAAGSDAGDANAAEDLGGDGAGDGAAGEGSGEGGGEQELTGPLWNHVKDKFAEGVDPKLRTAVNKAIHMAERVQKLFPDGMEAAQKTIQSISQLANEEGAPAEKVIAETLAERNYFRELDAMYTEARPEFAAKLAEASPEAFDKLAPMVFGKYSETNPDGFTKYVSSTVLSHMERAQVPLQFNLLKHYLPQLPDGPAKDAVIEACEAIYEWNKSLRMMAAKEVKAPEGAGRKGADGAEDLRTREEQIAARELNVTRQSWNAEAIDPGRSMVFAEAERIGAKHKLTADEKQKILAKVGEELDVRLAANKGYGEAMRGYLKNGQKAEFLQRLESERKKLIPGAVRRAVDDVVADRPKPGAKGGTQQQKQGQQRSGQQQQNNDQGGEKYEWIAGPPATLNMIVDLNRTPNKWLVGEGGVARAYVKGKQTPVKWKIGAK